MTQTIDGVLGETVNYAYDYLHRLTAATATNGAWGEAYSLRRIRQPDGEDADGGQRADVLPGQARVSNAQNGVYFAGAVGRGEPADDAGLNVLCVRPVGAEDLEAVVRAYRRDANECEAYFYGATGQKLESYSCEYRPNRRCSRR